MTRPVAKSPRFAEQCDVNIHSITHPVQDLTFDDYVEFDTDIPVWETLSDAESGVLDLSNTKSDEDELKDSTLITLAEGEMSINKLHNFSFQNHVNYS
ncbi:hypothetical protein TNCV_1099231 [Trichonephila clavipes]|nr:hypothetical protein TNCV_1099231 [Trichonephila clavipes]